MPRCSGTFIKKNRNIRVLGITASLALSILTIATIFPITKQSDIAEATYVPATTALSIVSSKDTASVDITPTSASGTFATSAAADMAEFTVTTNNLTGYSLNILGTDTSGQLVNSTTGDTLDTITADTTENDFRTGAASTYNNKWGYRLNINNTTTTDFLSAPTSTTVAKTIYSTTGPNTTGTSDSFTLGLGARIDYTKSTGTYTNTFIITAIANNISYQINYLDSDTTTTLLPSDAESNISASSIELNSTTPTKSGYTFLGWCDGTLSSDGTSCTGTPGTTYQPGDTYTFTALSSTTSNIANLYAVWEESAPIMQDLSLSQCTTTPMTVVDKRDNKEYTIARLADGQCWMISNLNLAGGTKLYSETSNVPAGYPESAGVGYYTLPASSSSGFSSDTTAYVYNTGNETTTQTSAANNSYYSWLAATAGGKDASGTAVTGNGPDAAYSICPKGWRLPKSGNQSDTSATSTTGYKKGDFYKLATAYGANLESSNYQNSVVFYQNAGPGTLPNFLLAGYYDSSTFYSGGTNGVYWSSSSYSSTYAYALSFDSSYVNSAGYNVRRSGLSVRCVLQPTMQNFTTQEAESMATGETKTLADSRDGKSYTVAKLADGNVWLLENLRLDISDPSVQANLTSATTNATDTTLGYLKNGGGSSPYPANGVIAKSASGGSWSNDYANPYIATSGTDSGGWTNDTIIAASGSAPAGKIGIYYNFCAASAGSYCYAANASSGDASEDICPAGWKMPTGGASGQYQALYAAYSSNVTNFETALNTPLSGYFYAGAASSWGVGGNFWASNRYDGYYMYYMDVYSSTLNPQRYYDRYYGFSVRCVHSS